MKRLILLMLLLEVVVASEKINYCDATLCNVGETHIACENNGAFGSDCGQNAHILKIDKNEILRQHNKLRSQIAQSGIGRLANLSADMQWDDELALMAEFGVRQCRPYKNDCFSTKNIKNTGLNFALDRFHGNPDANEMVTSQINTWIHWYKSAKPETGHNTKHFFQMIHGKTNRVGCAALQYKKDDMTNQLLTCIYNEPVKEGIRARTEPINKTSPKQKDMLTLIDWLKKTAPKDNYHVSAERSNTKRVFDNDLNLTVKNKKKTK